MKSVRTLFLIFLLSIFGLSNGLTRVPINKDAEAIAKAFPNFNPKSNKGKAEGDMKRLIAMIAKTNRDSLSSNTALLKKAMDFKDDIGDQQKSVSCGSLLRAWETAYALGAISEDHQFTGRATKGRYVGEKLVFENIVPEESLKGVSGYIGNLRLVPDSRARKKGDPVSGRDLGLVKGLQKVMHEAKSYAAMKEIQKSKVGKMAYNPGEEGARYEAEKAAAGDAVKQPPALRLVGQKLSSPAKYNGNRYRVRFEVSNLSRHPTEVVLEYVIVGYTDNDNILYEMKRHKETLKLRRSQVHEIELWTPNVSVFSKPLEVFDPEKSTKVYYRGYMITAQFDGKTIKTHASGRRLSDVVSGADSTAVPNILGLGKKKKKK